VLDHTLPLYIYTTITAMNTSSDPSDRMTEGQTLSTPLLSSLLLDNECDEYDEDYYDEEEEEVCMPCSLKIVASNKELDGVSGDASSQPSWWNGNCVTWVVSCMPSSFCNWWA
jgi:hypothetical protein